MCPPALLAEINQFCPNGVHLEIKKFTLATKARKLRGEDIPPVRREEFVMPKGGSIEYGIDSVKVSLPGAKPEEFVACPIPTTIHNPDPDTVRLASVIGQFVDFQKGVLANPINKEAVDHYSGVEGVVDGQKTNMVPMFMEKVIDKSSEFNRIIANQDTLVGEPFLEKLMSFLHHVTADIRYYLTWQLATTVLRLASVNQTTGALYFHSDLQGNSMYKGALIPIKRAELPEEDKKYFDEFKQYFKYPPMRIGKVAPKVKLVITTDESYRKAIKGSAAAVGRSRGLGKIVDNMNYCTGQSDQVRKACWCKAMVKSLDIEMKFIDVKCTTGVATLLLSQLKDEIEDGLRLLVSDSAGKFAINSAIISERRATSHVVLFTDLLIPSTPKHLKQEEDVEAEHKKQITEMLKGLQSSFIAGYTMSIPASHSCIFDEKHHVYALKDNFDGSVIYSTKPLVLDREVVTMPYDLPKDRIYNRTLTEVIIPIKGWTHLKEHTVSSIKRMLTYFMNPTYSCTPLGRIFIVNGTTEYEMMESELVYIGRKMEESGNKRKVREEMIFDDTEEIKELLGQAGVNPHVMQQQEYMALQQQPSAAIMNIASKEPQPVVIVPKEPEEMNFDLNE
jgi:hypothetical protein